MNARMYRGTWLILAVPLLLGAFSVARPTPLPPPFPPAFDTASADTLAREFARYYPDRFPGTAGAADARDWFRQQLEPYGLSVRAQPFAADVPGHGRVQFENLIATVPGRSARRIAVIAHRDDLGAGPGANDNASGTAAMIVLARAYATPGGQEDVRQGPAHTILFVSTDGGALGGLGARHFVEREGADLDAVIVLDSIAGSRTPALQLAGDLPRSPSGTLVETAAARILEETGVRPRRPSALRQLLDLAFPFSLYEQAPFVARGIPAVTLTTGGDAPIPPHLDVEDSLVTARLGELGGAAQTLIGSVDQGLDVTRGGAAHIYVGPRLIRGWAVQLTLVAALLPFLAATVDLFARCRRRRIPLRPAVRSYASRLGFWLFLGLAFAAVARLAWPRGTAAPIAPHTDVAGTWPVGGVAALGTVGVVAWLASRHRLIPRRPVRMEEELAGHTAALLVLGVIALLVVAVNAFALVFVLPALHAWLWLPHVHARPAWIRAGVLVAGLAGPALLLWSFWTRFGLGPEAPAYLVQLVAIGYVPTPLVVLFLAWAAVGAQLTAIAARRYAPYPSAEERPPRGPVRELVRRILLVFVNRRRASAAARRALEG